MALANGGTVKGDDVRTDFIVLLSYFFLFRCFGRIGVYAHYFM